MPEGWSGSWPAPAELRCRVEAAHGLALTPAEAERLLSFLSLLERWAGRFNLVSARSKEEVVERHLVDSLALASLVDPARSIADLGSGAGFPGIPLAILRTDVDFTLIEPRRHRANFLREAARRASLDNVRIVESSATPRAQDPRFDLVTGRAIRRDLLVEFATATLREGGRLLLMTKAGEGGAAPDGYQRGRILEYRLGRDRHQVSELMRCFT